MFAEIFYSFLKCENTYLACRNAVSPHLQDPKIHYCIPTI